MRDAWVEGACEPAELVASAAAVPLGSSALAVAATGQYLALLC